jgi:hypothetical protein
VYVPSSYEKLHEKMAIEINDNLDKLKQFLHSPDELIRSVAWLERVKIRMSTSEELPETEDDRKYLSRFEISKNCSGTIISTRIEWIEPLTMQSRHPFSYLHPVPSPGYDASIYQTDYVLFASSSYLSQQQSPSREQKMKSYLIDAGTYK